MKLAATVILYNPLSEFILNIDSYVSSVDLLIVIDNSEYPDVELSNQIKKYPNILFFSYPENIGVAKALNNAALIAAERGYEWMLTMDQDSMFSSINMKKLLGCFRLILDESNIGMVGVDYSNEKNKSDENCNLIDVNLLITSGSLMNLEVHKYLNGFDECLFIDEVDSEYCYRLRKNKFRVCKITGVNLEHNLGHDVIVKNWLIGSEVKRNIHSPLRIYYIIRNFLYVYFKYRRDFGKELNKNTFVVVNRIKNSFLYSPGQRTKVLFFAIKGFKDFFIGRFGKIDSKKF
jgi:rhamnosyltransferase